MSTDAWVSLEVVGEWCPALRGTFAHYAGTAALHVTSFELGRLRRNVFKQGRLDRIDLALFDAFPDEDRRAIIRELNNLLHRQAILRQEERARVYEAQQEAAMLRERLLTEAQRVELIDLGIWAHAILTCPPEAERLIDFYLDLTSVERVRAYVEDAAAIHAAFREAVYRAYQELRARQRPTQPGPAQPSSQLLLQDLKCLGLTGQVDRETVIQTYRRLAKEHHPDLGGDKARMIEINQAYARIAAAWNE